MDLKELFGNTDCEEFCIVGSVIRNPCTLCGKAHFAKTLETTEPMPNKTIAGAGLTEDQKFMIKNWIRPMATMSARCTKCGGIYSSGYLKICKDEPTAFCATIIGKKMWESPHGYTDDELMATFGITRSDLE